jgi:hypothetical protein
VRVQEDGPEHVRELGVSGHLFGQPPVQAHFGLGPGEAPVASVTVTFPKTGKRVALKDVPRNQTIVVHEPR